MRRWERNGCAVHTELPFRFSVIYIKTDWPVRYRHTNNAIEIRIVIIFSKVFNLIPPLFVKIQPYGSINGIKMQLFGSRVVSET